MGGPFSPPSVTQPCAGNVLAIGHDSIVEGNAARPTLQLTNREAGLRLARDVEPLAVSCGMAYTRYSPLTTPAKPGSNCRLALPPESLAEPKSSNQDSGPSIL